MKHDYLQSFRLPFVARTYWRRISQVKFLTAVRPFFANTSDEDILIFFEHSPALLINNGRNIFRATLKGNP